MKNSPETLKKRNKLKQYWKDTVDPTTISAHKLGICKDCKKEKLKRWAWTFTQTGLPEYRPRCLDCDSIFQKNNQKKNRKNISKSVKLRKAKRKRECINYLGGKCYRCDYNKSDHALTFHHKSRLDKTRDISSMLDYAWEKLTKELNKCVLVCFNCHMELEEEHRKS